MKNNFNHISILRLSLYLLIALVSSSCALTKKVPEESYLLNKVKIDTDIKSIGESQLKPYLRQRPNSSMLLLGRIKLRAYSFPDSATTWTERQLMKYGEPPVIYSDRLTSLSIDQLRLQLGNKGYLNAEVDTLVEKKDKKANLTYKIKGNDPYTIRHYGDTIRSVDEDIFDLLERRRTLDFIRPGDNFDLEVLERGRGNIVTSLRNSGYYDFEKDYIYFLADTTVGTHQVDLTVGLNRPEEGNEHQRYYMRHIVVNNGVDPMLLQDSTQHHLLDTVQFRDMTVISGKKQFMKPKSIYYNTSIRPGRIYSDRLVERSYSSLNRLGSVSQTSISLTPVHENDSNYIDAYINLTPGNVHHMQFGVDGTHSAGDLGIATDITYEHKNLLGSGESFRIKLNGAYEFIAGSDSTNFGDKSYYEYGAEAFLSIPQLLLPWVMKRLRDQPSASTEFSVGANFQSRTEYRREFFNLSSRLQWSRLNYQLTNLVEPIDITYVRMPWMSEQFRNAYMNDSINPILKASYEEQLIVRTGYTATYSNVGLGRRQPRMPYRLRVGVEVAGYIPRLITTLGGTKTNAAGRHTFLGLPYAEYVKADIDFAPTYPIDDRRTLAGHIAVGYARPYGNSLALPFEKRYYGGGANSVRGWSTRSLGPGTYRNEQQRYDFANKTGDIRLDLSLEYRRKLTDMFELAGFVDAGNIWTIREYQEQPGGAFEWSTFYKELAAAYGLGVRLDLNFLLLRVDLGMKAHDPARPEGERWSLVKPSFGRDFAFHFAIGYPF